MGGSRSITVTLETVTPMFLSGADGRTPELRPPSVRGALRYWWRAWYAGQLSKFSRSTLFDCESAVFGSTDGASPIVVRLSGQPDTVQFKRSKRPTGLDYLMYGMHERGKAIRPEQLFDLTLQVRPIQEADKMLHQAAVALWLLCNLGGLGARVRRGAGALRAVEIDGDWPDGLPPLDLRASSSQELSQKLAGALRILVGRPGQVQPAVLPIASLHSDLCIVSVFDKEWHRWDEALEMTGQAFQSFRNRYDVNQSDSDYYAVKRFAQTGQPPTTVKRAAFGLPLQFYYRGGDKATVDGQSPDGKEIDVRSASPLHFRVIRLVDGRYAVLMLVFITPLLPAGHRLRLSSRRRRANARAPGQDIIAEFLNYAGQQVAPLLEVKYQ